MARTQRIYKVDVKQLAEDVALAKVAGEDLIEQTILDFCKMYSIPIPAEVVKEKEELFKAVAEKLKKNKQ